jgi:uncharacterized protein (DUF2147 family)
MVSTFIRSFAFLAFLACIPLSSYGAELIGLWQEFDDDTGQPEALIRITQAADHTYEGVIETLLPMENTIRPQFCTHCSGNLQNKPLLGLRILSGMKRKDTFNFEGGSITDPDDGKTYRCHIRIAEDGHSLQLTGYLHMEWIGQSEIWKKVPQ